MKDTLLNQQLFALLQSVNNIYISEIIIKYTYISINWDTFLQSKYSTHF